MQKFSNMPLFEVASAAVPAARRVAVPTAKPASLSAEVSGFKASNSSTVVQTAQLFPASAIRPAIRSALATVRE